MRPTASAVDSNISHGPTPSRIAAFDLLIRLNDSFMMPLLFLVFGVEKSSASFRYVQDLAQIRRCR